MTSRDGLFQKVVQNINQWAEHVSDEEIQMFMSTLFEIVESAGFNNLDEILSNRNKYLLYFMKTFIKSDSAKRTIILNNFMNAVSGKVKEGSDDNDDYNVDWNRIECLMNDFETKHFNEDFNLFL